MTWPPSCSSTAVKGGSARVAAGADDPSGQRHQRDRYLIRMSLSSFVTKGVVDGCAPLERVGHHRGAAIASASAPRRRTAADRADAQVEAVEPVAHRPPAIGQAIRLATRTRGRMPDEQPDDVGGARAHTLRMPISLVRRSAVKAATRTGRGSRSPRQHREDREDPRPRFSGA